MHSTRSDITCKPEVGQSLPMQYTIAVTVPKDTVSQSEESMRFKRRHWLNNMLDTVFFIREHDPYHPMTLWGKMTQVICNLKKYQICHNLFKL